MYCCVNISLTTNLLEYVHVEDEFDRNLIQD